MAERFYCPERRIDERIVLEGDEARHLARVRRIAPGGTVEVFDGRGFATAAFVVRIGRDRVELKAVGQPLFDRAAMCGLTLATAVPKGERFDWLVEKATELGVERLVPLLTERSVVDPGDTKIDRLRRTIIEASKQCGRNRLMVLDRPCAWDAFLSTPEDATRLVAHPGGLRLPDWPRPRRGGGATLAIGPEGGFTDAEVQLARGAGWRVVGLGATLLRIETAGLAGCAMLLALCEGPEE